MDAEQQRESGKAPAVVYIPINRYKGEAGLRAIIDSEDEGLVRRFKWHLDTDGYAVRTVDPRTGEKEAMARLILGLRRGDGLETDHVSRDRLDNRRANLRVVTHAQNAQNRVRTDGISRYRGVSQRKGAQKRPFQAYGGLGGAQYHCGFYEKEIDAARAAEAFRRVHLPFSVPDASLEPLPPCRCKMCRS